MGPLNQLFNMFTKLMENTSMRMFGSERFQHVKSVHRENNCQLIELCIVRPISSMNIPTFISAMIIRRKLKCHLFLSSKYFQFVHSLSCNLAILWQGSLLWRIRG